MTTPTRRTATAQNYTGVQNMKNTDLDTAAFNANYIARAQHTFTNISEKWGDFVDATIDDYREMARIFGRTVDIEEREDGIYINGEQVAE